MTYVSELGAQFAKEGMACQSLDNDEILNVRWATEDPNPVQKVAEKRRLEELGQEAIKARMDPRIVEAMRAVRALEDGDVLDAEGHVVDPEDDDSEAIDSHEVKRRKLSPPQTTLNEESSEPHMGLLSADTLEGLRYFAEIRNRNGSAPIENRSMRTSGLGLADYGSDGDD